MIYSVGCSSAAFGAPLHPHPLDGIALFKNDWRAVHPPHLIERNGVNDRSHLMASPAPRKPLRCSHWAHMPADGRAP
jgi:hypothetical protein